MTHMLSKNKIKEAQNLTSMYDTIVAEASEEAKKSTNHLMSEINYYRTHSFEEIIEQRADLWTEDTKFHEDPDQEYTFTPPQEWYIRMELQQKHGSDPWDFSDEECQKYFDSMSEEEKKVAHIEGIKRRNDKVIGELRKQDLLYDALTEEQMSKLLELYYISTFKRKVVDGKEAILLGGKDAPLPSRGGLFGQNPHGIIFEAASIDLMGEKGLAKSETIKADLKDRLPALLALGLPSSLLGLFAAEFINCVRSLDGLGEFNRSLTHSAVVAFCIAVWPLAYLASSTIERKRIIKKAKELGIYDDVKERLKARAELEQYEAELESEYLEEEGKKVL